MHQEQAPQVHDREEPVARPLPELHVDHILLAVPELGTHDVGLELRDGFFQVAHLGLIHPQARVDLLVEFEDLVLQRFEFTLLEGDGGHNGEHARRGLRRLGGRSSRRRCGSTIVASAVLDDELPDLVDVAFVDLLARAERLCDLHRVLAAVVGEPPHALGRAHVDIEHKVVVTLREDVVPFVVLLLVLLAHDFAYLVPRPCAGIPGEGKDGATVLEALDLSVLLAHRRRHLRDVRRVLHGLRGGALAGGLDGCLLGHLPLGLPLGLCRHAARIARPDTHDGVGTGADDVAVGERRCLPDGASVDDGLRALEIAGGPELQGAVVG
mmetsp:Transcript_73757/g.167152  ORF Transcript_73757/g.167152 Transcript_73757/m.167152 type:complete len:325 (-) Transcript_73757:672-1646(-)